jgi:hypothetical protein
MTVGRNDPCPCGSNKKYKKCCLAKDEAARAAQLAAEAAARAAEGEVAPAAAGTSPGKPSRTGDSAPRPKAPAMKSKTPQRRKV